SLWKPLPMLLPLLQTAPARLARTVLAGPITSLQNSLTTLSVSRLPLSSLVAAMCLLGTRGLTPAIGQEISRGAPAGAEVRPLPPIALAAEPFGVMRLEVSLPPSLTSGPPRVLVNDSSGRLFYPALAIRTVEV